MCRFILCVLHKKFLPFTGGGMGTCVQWDLASRPAIFTLDFECILCLGESKLQGLAMVGM